MFTVHDGLLRFATPARPDCARPLAAEMDVGQGKATGVAVFNAGTKLYRLAMMGVLAACLSILSACEKAQVVDLPASSLTVKVVIIDIDETPADVKLPIVVQFFSSGKMIQLAGSATVACNGVAMPWNGLGYAQRVPLVPAGGNYACTHQRGGTNTTVNITAPPRPVITAPTSGSGVTRSNNLTITYVAGGGASVRASAGDGSTGLAGNDQTDNGTYTGFDVSSMAAGPGSVGLTRKFTFTPTGTGFQSVEVDYSCGADIPVSWL